MTAFPKPRKVNRQTSGPVDTSALALPKTHTLRDADYRTWVRTHRCLLSKYERACQGDIAAAHLQSGGVGIKGSDASCIPLCALHHSALDAETLPWQIVAFLWLSCWDLRERWHRRG